MVYSMKRGVFGVDIQNEKENLSVENLKLPFRGVNQ